MQNVDKIAITIIAGILFTLVFVPLLRYFVIQYFKDMRSDIADIRQKQESINTALTDHMEKDVERFSKIDERCADRYGRISRIEGRLNGK